MAGGHGATVDLTPLRPAGEPLLFGEGPGAFVVSGPRAVAARVRRRRGADRDRRRRRDLAIEGALRVPVAELSAAHAGGLADLL